MSPARRPPRARGCRRAVAAAGALLALLAAGASPLGAAAIQAPGGLALRSEGGGRARLESPAGAGRAVELPRPEALETLAETADGWIAAGSVARGGGSELLLVRERAGRVETLTPPVAGGRLRGAAVPLVDGGRLAGLAWLEGDRAGELAVRAAGWDGAAWRASGAVAAAADQVALRGAVLGDGSWLLLWARVEGGDSDLVWSRGGPDGWSAARLVTADNAVPDILPALAATADGLGAVAAWSRYDGEDYRLHLARFDGADWREIPFDSERGAGDPSFVTVDGALHLLYKAVVPDRWSVLRLDAAGRPAARGSVDEESYARPVLEPGPALWWAGDGFGEPRRRVRLRLEARP